MKTRKTLIFIALSAFIAAIAFTEGEVSLPRYKDNGNGTITDNLTGLMWVKNGNLMTTRDPTFDNDGTANDGLVTWQHAVDYVALLNSGNYASHTDWRLPAVNELESLINAEKMDSAAWLNAQGFSGVLIGYYWSSTTYASVTTNASVVYMYNGYVSYYVKTNNVYVLAVRAEQ